MMDKRKQMTLSIFVPTKFCICDKCGTKDVYNNMAHIGYNIDICKKCMGVKSKMWSQKMTEKSKEA